jgi:cytochrome c oxidase subunit 2
MQGTVYVMSPTEYAEWLEQGEPRNTLAKTGEHLFRELGCSGCHVNSPTVHAPPLEGIYGKLVPLADGTFVRADDQYIRDCILHPNAKTLAGYPPVMPTFEGRVTEEQLLELVAYIKSLGKESPPSK